VTLLDQSILLGDSVKLWEAHRPLVLLLLATAVLDALSTIAFLSVLGIERESNWLARYLSWWLGTLAGPWVTKGLQLLGVWGMAILAPRLARLVLTVTILLNLLAFVFNMEVFGRALINS